MTCPITLGELVWRIEHAARTETFSLNQLKLLAARNDAALYREALAHVRRQADALATAARMVELLAARPDLALALGIGAPPAGEVAA